MRNSVFHILYSIDISNIFLIWFLNILCHSVALFAEGRDKYQSEILPYRSGKIFTL